MNTIPMFPEYDGRYDYIGKDILTSRDSGFDRVPIPEGSGLDWDFDGDMWEGGGGNGDSTPGSESTTLKPTDIMTTQGGSPGGSSNMNDTPEIILPPAPKQPKEEKNTGILLALLAALFLDF